MTVTVQFDHTTARWRFTIERIKHNVPDWQSEYRYTTDSDAYRAGEDAIRFDLHYRMMEAAK